MAQGSPQFTAAQVLEAGQQAEAGGNRDYAIQFYRHVANHHPNSPEAAEARNALQRLVGFNIPQSPLDAQFSPQGPRPQTPQQQAPHGQGFEPQASQSHPGHPQNPQPQAAGQPPEPSLRTHPPSPQGQNGMQGSSAATAQQPAASAPDTAHQVAQQPRLGDFGGAADQSPAAVRPTGGSGGEDWSLHEGASPGGPATLNEPTIDNSATRTDRRGNSRLGNGTHGLGSHGSDAIRTEAHGAGAHGAGTHGTGAHGTGASGAESHGTDTHGSGTRGSSSRGSGLHVNGFPAAAQGRTAPAPPNDAFQAPTFYADQAQSELSTAMVEASDHDTMPASIPTQFLLPSQQDHYRTGRFLAMTSGILGWLVILGGLCAAILGSGLIDGLPKITGLNMVVGIAYGVIGLFAGMLMIFVSQLSRAVFDNANAARDLAAIERARARQNQQRPPQS